MKVDSKTKTIVSAGDMTGNLTSATFQIEYFLFPSVQCVWTGTPTGTIQVNSSNDGTNWTPISGASQATGGAAGNVMFNFNFASFAYLQVIYTASSGSGALTVTATAKG